MQMRLRRTELFGAATIVGGSLLVVACSGGEDYPGYAMAGTTSTGTGGTSTTTGGTSATTGGATGGIATTTGGVSTGGTTANTGGSSGGTIFGGGGKSSGGSSNTGGKSGNTGGSGGKSGSTGGSGGKSGSTGGSGGKSGGTGGSGGKSGSTGGSGGGGAVMFSQVVSIIGAQCSNCHKSGGTPNLSTSSASTLYTTLTSTSVSKCGGNRLVTPNDPSKSALLMLTTGKCGDFRMPVTCTTSMCLSAADQTTITNWINSGAKNP
jgi:hypothetical protein